MSVSSPAPLDIQEVPQIVSRHRGLLVAGALIGGLLFGAASPLVPRRYKSHFVLTIYTKYFQSPLIGDFVPSLGESGEARAQRDSLIRQTLAPEYLDSLGEKYGIYVPTVSTAPPSAIQKLRTRLKTQAVKLGLYHPPGVESRRSAERQNLLSRIEIYSLNNTTFNIGFSYSNPRVAYQVTQELHERIIQNLLDVRMGILVNVRDAIQRRLRTIASSSAGARAAKQVPLLPAREELKSVREELRSLTVAYTDAHPLVRELRDREKFLMRSLHQQPAGAAASGGSAPVPEDEAAAHEVSGDLVKKLNYLDIAIDSDQQHQGDYFATLEVPLYPTGASGPGKAMFVVGGLVFGLLCSIFIAGLREYFERTALRANALAQRLGLPLLGQLPPLPPSASVAAKLLGSGASKSTG